MRRPSIGFNAVILRYQLMDLDSNGSIVVYACEPQGRPPKPGQTRRRIVFEEQMGFTLRGVKITDPEGVRTERVVVE